MGDDAVVVLKVVTLVSTSFASLEFVLSCAYFEAEGVVTLCDDGVLFVNAILVRFYITTEC